MANNISDEDGQHCRNIHSVHPSSAIEKALLMVVLALAYCKGDPRNDGSRWILDKDLYHFLNMLDENIPDEPPAAGSKKKRVTLSQSSSSRRLEGGLAQTPDVDALLEKFEKQDYLLKTKAVRPKYRRKRK